MSISYRIATDSDFEAMCDFDGAAFGAIWEAEERAAVRPTLELDRFVLAHDGSEIVGVAGNYSQQLTVPGDRVVPSAGVTWVAVGATHRRRGILTELMRRLHEDAAERGEPITMLTASEGGIYERFDYGIASLRRVIEIDRRRTQLQPRFRPEPGTVRFVDPTDEVLAELDALFDRIRRGRNGEIARSLDLFRLGRVGRGAAARWVRHEDGFASWKVTPRWHDGHPAHEVELYDLAAATPEAHAALWHTILSLDLVGPIRSLGAASIDDPLPSLLEDPRALRTTDLNDMMWVRLGDVRAALSSRTYATDDRLTVDVGDERFTIDGSPDGASVRRGRPSRRRADLTLGPAELGAIYLGGVRPSSFVRARRADAKDETSLRRADLFFSADRAPHCSTGF